MKPLLYIFVLFIFILPVTSHSAKRRGRVKNPNSHKLRRIFNGNPLIPQTRKGLAGKARQTLKQLEQNNQELKTLQEVQDEVNNRKKQRKRLSQRKWIIAVIESHEDFFTALMIQKYFPEMFPDLEPPALTPIHDALNQLKRDDKVFLIQQGERRSPNVWITITALKKKNLLQKKIYENILKVLI